MTLLGKVQFPLVNLRKDTVNKWHLEHFTSEIITVPELPNQYGFHAVSLNEIPSDGSIPDSLPPRINGFTQYKGDPINPKTGNINFSQTQFYVNYTTGEILFHPSQAGKILSVDYFAKGSLVEAEDVNFLYDKVIELENAQFKPQFTSFRIANMPSILEIGQTFPIGTVLPIPTTFTWEVDKPELLLEDSIYITMGVLRIASNVPTSVREHTVDISQVQRSETPFKLDFAIHATTITNEEIERIYSVEWVDRIYYGVSNDKTATSQKIKSMPSLLLPSSESSQSVVLNFPEMGNAYKTAAVPQRYPIKICKDSKTGLEFVLDEPELVNLPNSYGITVPYYVYFSSNSISSSVELNLELGA